MIERALPLPQLAFEKLLIILAAIWRNRNDVLWNEKSQALAQIVLSSLSWLQEFQVVRKPSTTQIAVQQRSWKPPKHGFVKLNVDGSYIAQKTTGGTGGVVRDDQGKFIAAFAKPIFYVVSAKQVELMAIKEGLLLLISLGQMGQKNIQVEYDCSEAVAAMNSVHHEGMIEAGLIDDIKELMKVFSSV